VIWLTAKVVSTSAKEENANPWKRKPENKRHVKQKRQQKGKKNYPKGYAGNSAKEGGKEKMTIDYGQNSQLQRKESGLERDEKDVKKERKWTSLK